MTFLPIVERELRVASRLRGTYWGRIWAALVALLIGGWVAVMARDAPPAQLASILFYTLSSAFYFYAVTIGLKVTADCLSEEKRDGTLGLLFLTDLKGYDIVLGKLVATSLNSFYSVLAVLPVLAIPLLLGGVTNGEFARAGLVTINLLVFALTLGLFASAVCRDERKAVALALGVGLVLFIASPLAGSYHEHVSGGKYLVQFLLPSPAYSCFLVPTWTYPNMGSNFWICSGITLGYSLLFLVLASVIVPRTWHDRVVTRETAGWKGSWRDMVHGDAERRRVVRARLLGINPMLWLTGRQRSQGVAVWGFLVVIASFWIWGWAEWKSDWLAAANYVFTAMVVHTALKGWLAASAARQLAEDRRTGALELLLSTPLEVGEIVHGQMLALRRQFGGPVMAVVVVDLIFFTAGLSEMGTDVQVWTLTWTAGMLVLICDLVALGYLGMWMGLTTRRANQAASSAVFLVMTLPWVLFALLMTFLSWFLWLSRVPISFSTTILIWMGLSVAFSLVATRFARRLLLQRLRLLASHRVEPGRRGFWKWLAGKAAPVPPVLGS